MADEIILASELDKVDDSDIMTQPFSLSETDPIVSAQKTNYMTGEELSQLGKVSPDWNSELIKVNPEKVFGTYKTDLNKVNEFIVSATEGGVDYLANLPDKTKNEIAQLVIEGHQDKNKLTRHLMDYFAKALPGAVGSKPLELAKQIVDKSNVFKEYDEKLLNTLDGREYPLVDWAKKTLALTTQAIKDREYARVLRAEERGIDREAWSNEIARSLGAMLTLIALGKGAGTAAKALGASAETATAIGGNVMKATTLTDMAGEYAYNTAAQYVEQTGDRDFTNFTPEDAKGVSALGYGAIGTLIEYGFGGVEPLFASGMEKLGTNNILKAVGKTMAGEAWEEFLQEWEEFLFRKADGTNTRTWGETLKDSLKSAVYGGLIGGVVGDVAYRTNRRNIANVLVKNGLDYGTAVKVADTVINDTGAEIFKRADENISLKNLYGETYDKLQGGIKTALETAGWNETIIDQDTKQPLDIDSYSGIVARDIASQVIRMASQSGLSPNEFLDVASFQAIDNVLYLKPITNLKEQIDQQDAIIKRESELKKTGAGDNAKIQDAKMRKAILQKAYNIEQYKSKQYKQQLERQKTPETTKEIERASKDVENVKKMPTQVEFDSKVDTQTENGKPLTTGQKTKRYGNAVLKRILPGKTDFEAVMVDPKFANAKQALISVADRINAFMTAHRTYGLKTDIANALKKMQTIDKGNFIDSITYPALDGVDVIAENAFLYNFLFNDSDTIKVFMDSYITRAEQSINGEIKPELSKKDLVGQAFETTDKAMQAQAKIVGSEYKSIFNEDGSYADKNVMAVMLSYQNQFVSEPTQLTLFQEQFDLADENARLDDIYPTYDGETIEVDGKERTVYNSNGDRIAKSKEALTNFWRWFGDSKVVDEQGRPLVVYHGTSSKFDTFKIGEHGGTYGTGIYFGRKTTADRYGIYQMPVYLKIENPFIVEGNNYRELAPKANKAYQEYIKKDTSVDEDWLIYDDDIINWYLKDQGFDGVVDSKYIAKGANEFVAFEPTQIKSTDNRGTYSADTGNIYYQANIRDFFKPIVNEVRRFVSDLRAAEKTDVNVGISVGELPAVYKSLGWKSGLVKTNRKVLLKDTITKHNVDIDTVERLPELYSDPLMVFQSATEPDRLVAVLDATDKNGDQIIVALSPNKKEIGGYHFIPSFYGKEKFQRFLKDNIDKNRVKYIKDPAMSGTLQSWSQALQGLDTNTILTQNDVVNQNVGQLFQGKKANGMYDPELGVIVLGRNMNTMTLPHEMQHYWLDTIFSIYKRAQAGELKVKENWLQETKDLFDMLGIDENQNALTKPQQEKFARMSEAYLTGIGVDPAQNQTFKEYLAWVPEKYKGILNLGYLNNEGRVVYPHLDTKAVEFFNKWYDNNALPSLPTSPERQRFINPTDDKGEIIPAKIKEMNDRNKEFAQDAEEQIHTDTRLYNTLDENMPDDIKVEADGQRVVQESRSNFLKESEKQQRRWFERKSRDTEAKLAQDYIEKNPEHAKEVIFGDPELVPNDTGVDRATLINAYMALNKIQSGSDEWAILHTNIAINQSLAGTQLGLNNNTSYEAYRAALREIEAARELKAATNYAGTNKGAWERFNRDIKRFVDEELPKVLATEANSEARETALKSLFERARTKFSGNTTGGFLMQEDFDYAKAQKKGSAAFTTWVINQIKKDAGAKLKPAEQAKLLEISAKAQQGLVDIDNLDSIGISVAGAQEIRKWQVEQDKLINVSPNKFNFIDTLFNYVFGSWGARAMLSSFNTLVVANIPSTAMNTGVVRALERGVFGVNEVSDSLTKSEIKRIKAIYGATAMNLAQMEKPTSPSLLHGEKYSTSGQKWYDPFTILGKEDNWFRVPTFVNTLARIATTDAKATNRSVDDVFKEYCRLNNQSDAAKLARKQALAVANMAVFTQDGIVAKTLNMIRSEINELSRGLLGLEPKGFGLGSLISPFLKTGANIAEMGIRGSIAPITELTARVKAWRTGKAIDPMKRLALNMDWTYFTVSSVAVALLAALTSDKEEFYAEPYESGKAYDPNKPYDSINIGGVWIDLDFFGPFAIPIRAGCLAVKQWETDKGIIGAALKNAKYAAMDTPLLESVFNNQVGYATKKPGDWALGYGYNLVNKLVPAQIKPLSRLISRETGTELDTDWMGKVIQKKFHRNYGLDGAQPTTQDWIDVFTTKITLEE